MSAKTTQPARCTVAVIWGEHVVSHVYPAAIPLETFIDDVVELVSDDLKRRGAPGPEAAVAYELQRVNGVRLDNTKTLDELGVGDGAALVLAISHEGEPFEPQCESLSTGLAKAGKVLFPPVTERTAARTALAIVALIAAVILGLAARIRAGTESLTPALIAGCLGVTLAIGGVAVHRCRPERRDMAGGLACIAVPLVAFAGAAAAPGGLGSPHLFIGALAGAVLSSAVGALTNCPTMAAAAVATGCGITGVVAAAAMWQPLSGQWIGMSLLIGLLFLVTAAPTVALWAARLRPPHFGSVTGRDLFSRGDGMPADAVVPVGAGAEDTEDCPAADSTPTGPGIAAAALRANGILTGLCLAVAVALPVAVWSTVLPGQPRSGGAAVLAALFVVIFISRARSFADRRQAVALVCGAAAAFGAGVARYALAEPDTRALLWAALVLIGFGAAGLAAALLVPVTPFTPLVRMVTEWLELAAIAAAWPLAAWVGGMFAWIRVR